MNNKAPYALIGFLTLILLFGLVSFVFWKLTASNQSPKTSQATLQISEISDESIVLLKNLNTLLSHQNIQNIQISLQNIAHISQNLAQSSLDTKLIKSLEKLDATNELLQSMLKQSQELPQQSKDLLYALQNNSKQASKLLILLQESTHKTTHSVHKQMQSSSKKVNETLSTLQQTLYIMQQTLQNIQNNSGKIFTNHQPNYGPGEDK